MNSNFKKMIRFLTAVFLVGHLSSCVLQQTLAPLPESPSAKADQEVPPDHIQRAYSNFTLASIHMANRDNEKARHYLSLAIEGDPESTFLYRKMALLLKQMKSYQEAADYALKAIELDPDKVGNHVILADIYTVSGKKEKALQEYKKIIELDPRQNRVRLILTTILIRNGQFKVALEHINQLIQQDPNLVIAHYYRGRIHLELRNFKEAESAYLETLKLNKRMEPALFDLASLYQMEKKNLQAAEIYETLLGYYPANSTARERLINLYFRIGDETKAEKHMNQIKDQTKPGDPNRQALGLIYLRHGKLDKSIEELDLIVSAWPEDDKSRYYLASAYEEKGESEKALTHFRMLKKESSHFINAQMHIAYILDGQEKHGEGIEVLKRAIEIEPKKPDLYLMLASMYEAKKEYNEAVGIIEEGLRQDKENIDLMFRLAVILDKSGKKEECLQSMRKILMINANHADALNYIGYTYAEQGIRLDEALDLVQKALKLKPNSGYIIDSLGWVYYQKGMYDEAMTSLEKAASLTPDDPTISEHLGDVYYRKAMYQKALEMYQKALTLNHPQKDKVQAKIEEVKKRVKN
ncbi:tetratricopeptide repeat protein [Thermodesulfobacteriota bacterium]